MKQDNCKVIAVRAFRTARGRREQTLRRVVDSRKSGAVGGSCVQRDSS